MEHTIYLAAKAFINKVKPQTPKNKRSTKNGTASVKDVDDDDDNMDVDDGDWISDWNQLNELPDDEEVDDIVDFTAGDVLGKTLALVNQVSFFSFVHFPLLIYMIDPCFSSSKAVFCSVLQV
jgi:hypothetical protein